MKEQKASESSTELKLKLGDEVHLLPNTGSNTIKTLLHKALINTNYEFTALPRQLKKFAEAAGKLNLNLWFKTF